MKQFYQFSATLLFLMLLLSTAQAATPEQVCQSRKNSEAAKFVACRHKVLSRLPDSRFGSSSISNCKRKFNRGWRRATNRAERLEANCLEAPLGLQQFRDALRANVNNITTQLGKNENGIAAKRRCRALKTVAAGRYTACRFRAESRRARFSDTPAYEARISRCEVNLERGWQRIIERTEARGTTCFDEHLAVDHYKSAIDTHTDKVSGVLEGVDELDPVSLSVTGSPLALVADGAAKSITIKNASEKATVFDIEADFSGTALEGKVSETENTCSSVAPKASCTLTFAPGSSLVSLTKFAIQGSNTQSASASIEVVAPASATLSVDGSPLSLTLNGATGNLTISNASATITALNVASDLTGTALDGNIVESVNNCSSIAPGASCTLTFTPGGSVVSATEFYVKGSNTQSASASIEIVGPATATLSVDGSPLSLALNGATGDLTITNTSTTTTALNVASDLTGTALNGNIVESANTCSSVAPGASCTLTFTSGGSVVSATEFSVKGSNTVTLTPSISVQSGSTLTSIDLRAGRTTGGTVITLTGTGLTDATSVTFGGIEADPIFVEDSTTVYALTPAHSLGVVDIVIDTPAGGATLAEGYTYVEIGQETGGGVIGCLNNDDNYLIAAKTDISDGVQWGPNGNLGASSDHNGAANTATIVAALGNNNGTPYAAQLCHNYEVDSEDNTPCEAANTCYDDWFLPAGNHTDEGGQLHCLSVNGIAIGGFSAANYWSSTESGNDPANQAYRKFFFDFGETTESKASEHRVRCARRYVP